MLQNARRLGHHRWLCLQLFEVLGAHVAATADPTVKPVLAAHAHHLAWHADLLAQRFPELDELDAATLTVPADAAIEQQVAILRHAPTTDELLYSTYRVVLPRLLADCSEHLAEVDALTDGPTARVLTLIVRDLVDDVRVGEVLLRQGGPLG